MSPQSELDPTGRSSGIFLFNGFFYEGIVLLGMLWALIPGSIGLFFGIEYSILEWFILSLVAGLTIQLITFGLKLVRFRNPVTNAELLSLFEEVKADIGTGQDIQLWFRDIDRAVFLSTTNPFFRAILLSESTIADLLEKPEKGKVVLAREALMMQRVSPISGLALGLLAFVFISLNEGAFFTFSLFSFFSIDMMSLGIILIFAGIMVVIILASVIVARSTKQIDKTLEDLYGCSPEAVTAEVLTGHLIPDKIIDDAKRDEAEGKPSLLMKMLKRSILAVVITIPASFFIQVLLLPRMLEFILVPLTFSAILGFMVFMLTFLIIPMFHMIREHSKRTTDWDIQHPFADSIQQFLGDFPDYENLAVKAVTPQSNEMFGLVVERPKHDSSGKAIFDMSPQMLKDIEDVNLAGPLVLSEVRRKDIERKYNLLNYSLSGLAVIILTISMIWAFSYYSFDLIITFLPVLIICPILLVPPSIALSVWKRRAEIKSDVEIARKYPQFLVALQTLVDRHHTQPYGITSYRTRLERIKERLP